MICPKCSFTNPVDFAFCGKCGALLTETVYAPDADRRQITVMFCDMVGSTPLAERLDPEEFREVLRGYQETCVEAITRFGGYIARYVGDGLLVYFGIVLSHPGL